MSKSFPIMTRLQGFTTYRLKPTRTTSFASQETNFVFAEMVSRIKKSHIIVKINARHGKTAVSYIEGRGIYHWRVNR
jgi:hypothetical protein